MFRILVITMVFFLALSDRCPFDEHCVACNGSRCDTCVNAYADANGECIPDSSVADCSVYTSKGQCEECRLGYFLTSNACQKIPIANCAIIGATNDSCKACFDSRLVENGRCDSSNSCNQENCEICTSMSCLQCRKGYTVNSLGKCIEEPTAGCHFKSSVSNHCSLCKKGYYMFNSHCSPTKYTSYTPDYRGLIVMLVMLLIIC